MTDHIWRTIIEVHQYTKEMFLLGEEIDPHLNAFLQPKQEHWHAHDHVVNAKASRLGLRGAEEEGYIRTQLDKALSHEFRAFFDMVDYLTIVVRDKIAGLLEEYDSETLVGVFPEYYESIRPDIERITPEIARIRGQKDSAGSEVLLGYVREYRTIVACICEHFVAVHERIPSLEDYRRRTGRKRRLYWAGTAAIAVIAAVVGALLAKWLG